MSPLGTSGHHVSPGFPLLLPIYLVGFFLFHHEMFQAASADLDTSQIYLASGQPGAGPVQGVLPALRKAPQHQGRGGRRPFQSEQLYFYAPGLCIILF